MTATKQRVRRHVRSMNREPTKPHTTPGTRLTWSTVEDWLEVWKTLQGRRWRAARIGAEQAHIEALDDATIRACASVAELEAVREIAHGRRWRDRKPVGRGGESASAILRMRCNNQAQRIRATVPDFAALALQLQIEKAVELVTVEAT